jgi:hypothetical protein
MFFLMWMLVIVFGSLVVTGLPHRWMRARGLGRYGAVLAQAVVLASLATVAWNSFDARLQTPPSQLALLFTWILLTMYGSILLLVRWKKLP